MVVATRLLERDDELRLLNAAFDRAAGGAGSVVLVSGEAGIGKTRPSPRRTTRCPGPSSTPSSPACTG